MRSCVAARMGGYLFGQSSPPIAYSKFLNIFYRPKIYCRLFTNLTDLPYYLYINPSTSINRNRMGGTYALPTSARRGGAGDKRPNGPLVGLLRAMVHVEVKAGPVKAKPEKTEMTETQPSQSFCDQLVGSWLIPDTEKSFDSESSVELR